MPIKYSTTCLNKIGYLEYYGGLLYEKIVLLHQEQHLIYLCQQSKYDRHNPADARSDEKYRGILTDFLKLFLLFK